MWKWKGRGWNESSIHPNTIKVKSEERITEVKQEKKMSGVRGGTVSIGGGTFIGDLWQWVQKSDGVDLRLCVFVWFKLHYTKAWGKE